MEKATVTKLCMCPECGGASLLCPYGTTTLPLYTAPPVPRDVLMAALTEINSRYMEVCGAQFGGEYISAIADRYASQVQPEPVNQQTLAALKKAVASFDVIEGADWIDRKVTKNALAECRAAIAAAEAAQPDHIGDTDKMVHAVPDVLEQLQLAETEVTNAKAWSAGEQAKTHCKYALTAIAVARSLLSAAQKQEGGE